ncbi:cytidine deaminase [Dysgonomonas sp. Marseille-P4677]|uniref:cytidine deaminase n=1 Tax=Dysgonomonas sp. Marseille-P4677 TaxID=2364790 RepID=UPI001914C9A7|nr:cytidine deaminase [Dysgonomonas sp. Marseille-P4677]MBK5722374.1 cytidine deaminase [Dysgonomonas sp. Marseille-P4677]
MESLNLTTKILVYGYEESTEDIKKLIDEAKSATKGAYAPYSGFHVGAAIMLANGKIVTGNNQENAAYPSGLCAERVAIFSANSQYPDIAITTIAIAALHNGSFTDSPCCPCGGCRQTMVEIENRFDSPLRIVMYGEEKIYEVESIKTLLPLSFSEKSLSE